ncbi:MAG: hypothetical protein JWN07_1558 [Hyphomicrobiales bacterium]|nr:hypothetical protein [Hyphomicrobiales bacterium]
MLDRTPGARGHYPAAFFIYALAALALASPWLSGRYTIPWDAKAHFYPQLVFLAKALQNGESPFWNPDVFAGSFHIADPQSLIFTLPFWLVAKFVRDPGFIAADATVFVMIALGGAAIMLHFRDRGWHPAGAIVAALSFAFGGSAAWRVQHVGEVLSLAFFAITFLFLARVLQRGGLINGVCAGLFAGLMLIGRDQIAYLCAIVLAIYAVGGLLEARARRVVGSLAAAAITGLAVIAVPILLTIILAQESTRVLIDFQGAARGSLHPAALLTAVVANLYGVDGPLQSFWGPPSQQVWGGDYNLARNMASIYLGALPLIGFLGFGLAAAALFRREMAALLIAFVLMVLYALGDFTPFFRLAFHLPGVDLFRRPSDATFPLCALASIMGGYAVHLYVTQMRRQTFAHIVLPVLAIALAFGGAVAVAWWKGRLEQAAMPLAVAGACLLVSMITLWLARLFAPERGTTALVLVALCMAGDLALSNGPNESTALPPAHYDVMRPDTNNETISLLRQRLAETAGPDRIDRVELAAVGFDWPNLGMIHGFQHDLGYNPVRLAWYVEATGAQDHVATIEQRHFSPLFPSYRSLLADMLGLRFIASGVPLNEFDKTLKRGDLVEVARTKDAYVYENPRALPRVLLTTKSRGADFGDLMKTGAWPAFNPRETVLLEGADVTDARARRAGSARILAYENTQVRVAVDAPDGGWLVLNDVWHPWWRVEVDGAPAQMLRANVIFRAVALPPGARQVRFFFDPARGLRTSVSEAFAKTWTGAKPRN